MMDKKIFIRAGIAAACILVAGIAIFLQLRKHQNNQSSEFSKNIGTFGEATELRPGSVYTDRYTPLHGAVVVANNKKFVTNKDGAWEAGGVVDGAEILVLAYGYAPYEGRFDVASPIILNPLPATDITVRVYDEESGLINDAFVILLDSNTREPKEIARLNQNGLAVFKDAPVGDTIFFALKKGYHLGWDVSEIDPTNNTVSLFLKKRAQLEESKNISFDRENLSASREKISVKGESMTKPRGVLPFIDVVHAQDAGAEFEEAYPDEYRLIIERDENAAAVEGIELSPDDVADELTNDPNKKDWKSLGADHLQFSDEIPEGYHLQRKIVDGKEVFVVETDVYTDSVMQRMFGMGVDYGELSTEAQARKKVQAELGGRPRFETSLYWNWDKMGSSRYVESLYDTKEQPVGSSFSPVMRDGGMTQPATLYDSDGNPVTTPEVLKEFLDAAKQIHEANPQFSVTVNGSKEPTVVVGEPFTIEAVITLNHDPAPGWYILSPAAIRGYFQSRWIDNPWQKFQGPGKIMPYLLQHAPPRNTQFTKTHIERQQFTCLELGEEIVTYSFEVGYRFAQTTKDLRGLVEPGSSHYTYRVPLSIRCVGPELLSRKAPDKCGNPANVPIRGRVGGEHLNILDRVEVYITEDERGIVGSYYTVIDDSGSFETTASLSPGSYYYWVFGHTKNGHFYLLDEYEGSIYVSEKEEGNDTCEEDEEDDEQPLEVPVKTPPPSEGQSGCGGSGGGSVYWVCPR